MMAEHPEMMEHPETEEHPEALAARPDLMEHPEAVTARMDPAKLRSLNTDALAYVGDAVYELAVRQRVLQSGITRADRLHKTGTTYVRADSQAAVCRSIYEELTEPEQAMVRRFRNHKYHSKAKHADPMTYKWATAFEALAGYLYLAGDEQRLAWLFDRAFAILEAVETD